jgi:heme-degrading monooxygenase HmoA
VTVSGELIQPEKLDQAKFTFEAMMLPALKALKGFEKAYLLENSGEVMIIMVWDNKDSFDSLRDNAHYNMQTQKLFQQLAPGKVRKNYDLVAQA